MAENKSGAQRYASGKAEALKALDAGIDAVIVGAGFAGAVVARELAERSNMKVLILEQRPHVGGNAYDTYDEAGALIHAYGPHIFHTNSERAYSYLSRFTGWLPYQHEVLANIHDVYTPVPFNFNSIEQHFAPAKAALLIERLTESFGADTKVPIIELRQSEDALLAELADFVYNNVFLYYTLKQWGLKPEEVDPSVTARVPVYTGRDNRYFTDAYQGMPELGYTPLFDNLLAHDNIKVVLGVDARELLAFVREGEKDGDSDFSGQLSDTGKDSVASAVLTPDGASSVALDEASHLTSAEQASADEPFVEVLVGGVPFTGPVIYTGPLDFLASRQFGMLPYRSLDFVYKTLEQKHFQPVGTVNYTVSEDYTRITEFTWLTAQELDCTTIMKEYPCAFEDKPGQVPYYAILDPENQAAYERYLALFGKLSHFYALGRLAEYRYFNMDQIVERALDLADKLVMQLDAEVQPKAAAAGQDTTAQ